MWQVGCGNPSPDLHGGIGWLEVLLLRLILLLLCVLLRVLLCGQRVKQRGSLERLVSLMVSLDTGRHDDLDFGVSAGDLGRHVRHGGGGLRARKGGSTGSSQSRRRVVEQQQLAYPNPTQRSRSSSPAEAVARALGGQVSRSQPVAQPTYILQPTCILQPASSGTVRGRFRRLWRCAKPSASGPCPQPPDRSPSPPPKPSCRRR